MKKLFTAVFTAILLTAPMLPSARADDSSPNYEEVLKKLDLAIQKALFEHGRLTRNYNQIKLQVERNRRQGRYCPEAALLPGIAKDLKEIEFILGQLVAIRRKIK